MRPKKKGQTLQLSFAVQSKLNLSLFLKAKENYINISILIVKDKNLPTKEKKKFLQNT